MFNDMLKKLKSQFMTEDENDDNGALEDEVMGQLDRSSKLDEVDTVTFGLETDDGKIVKVYVKADQADEFEKALSQKLGEVDDIEETLNELSKDFEIVDVEWPGDDKKKKDDAAEADEEGQPETDGSEVMNKAVYKDKSGDTTVRPKMEGLEFGDVALMKIMEADHGSIEGRLSNATQLMIYHALIELGVPEIALNKSPYKASIVQGIKHRSIEMAKNPALKVALKVFLQKAHDLDHHSHHKEEKVKESLENLMIYESVAADFWTCVSRILDHLGGDDPRLEKLKNSTKLKTLVSRSAIMIPKVVKTDLRMKLSRLSDALEKSETTSMGVLESTTPDDVSDLFNSLFTMIDPTPNKSVSKTLLSSSEFKAFIMAIRPKLSTKFSGGIQQKYRDVLSSIKEAAAAGQTTSTVPTKPTNAPTNTNADVKEAVIETPKRMLREAVDWEFSMEDDVAKISCEGLKFSLDSEQFEKALKAISLRETVVVKDADDAKNKYTFSPRGVSLVVKKVGENKVYQMTSTDIKKLTDLVGEDKEEKKDKKDEEE